MAEFIAIKEVAPPLLPRADVNLERLEKVGLWLRDIRGALLKVNQGEVMYGYAVGVNHGGTGGFKGLLLFIPYVNYTDLKGEE